MCVFVFCPKRFSGPRLERTCGSTQPLVVQQLRRRRGRHLCQHGQQQTPGASTRHPHVSDALDVIQFRPHCSVFQDTLLLVFGGGGFCCIPSYCNMQKTTFSIILFQLFFWSALCPRGPQTPVILKVPSSNSVSGNICPAEQSFRDHLLRGRRSAADPDLRPPDGGERVNENLPTGMNKVPLH